jgi:hypothetical protein
LLSAESVNPRSVAALLAIGTLVAGCGPKPDDEGTEVLDVNVAVTAEHVEVHAHQPGSCREATAFPSTSACETFGWALLGVESTSATELCRPEPTCVTEIRLERNGEVVGSSDSASVSFHTALASDEASIVLSGCGDPIVVKLPPPLEGDVDFAHAQSSNGILVQAVGPSVAGVLGRAEGVVPFAKGFLSACRSDSELVTLPTSDDFDTYVVTSLALGTPVISENGAVQVFPARKHQEIVSQAAPAGAVWEAAVLLAQQSPSYPGCEAFCESWQTECAIEGDFTECAVQCTAIGSLKPSCSEQWDALIQCQEASSSCRDLVVVAHSEDPSQRQQQGDESDCPAEESAFKDCYEAE